MSGGIGADVDALLNGREAIRQALAGYNFGTLPNMAEAIQTNPGPLLEALAEAGVLREERRPVACHACGRTPCLARCRVNDDRRIRARYVTTFWEPTDARP